MAFLDKKYRQSAEDKVSELWFNLIAVETNGAWLWHQDRGQSIANWLTYQRARLLKGVELRTVSLEINFN